MIKKTLIFIVIISLILTGYHYRTHLKTAYNEAVDYVTDYIEQEEEIEEEEQFETEEMELYQNVETFVTVNYLGNMYSYEYTGLRYDYWPINEEEKIHYIPFGLLFFEDKGLELGTTGGSITSLTIVSNGEISESEYSFFVATMPMIEMFDYNDIIIVDIIIEQEQEGWELN